MWDIVTGSVIKLSCSSNGRFRIVSMYSKREGKVVVSSITSRTFADDILVVAEFIALLMSVSAKKEYHNREKHGAFQKAVANVY